MIRRAAAIATLFLLALSSPAPAGVIDEVARDFKPVSGYVIMPVQGEFLIDKDATNGVEVGDLFSVVKPGEKVIHPVTKEVLGSLDEIKGLLQVTRVKSGYSYARPVGEAKGIERGDVVRRYENVTSALWDYTGGGEAFFTELKAALPNLEWQDYAAAQTDRPQVPAAPAAGGPGLVFVLRHDGLEVHGAGFQTIHAYPPPAAISGPPTPSATAPAPLPVPVPRAGSLEERLQVLEQRLEGGQEKGAEAPYRLEEQPTKGTGRVAYEASFPSFINVGALPDGTKMADFTEHEGNLLMVSTDGADIRVYSVANGAISPVAVGDTTRVGDILSVHWWQPDAGGPLYVASTVSVELNQAGNKYIGHKAIGAVFRLEEGKLVPAREEIPYILGAFDRDGDGRSELLLGQFFDRQIFFGKVRELRLKGGDIESFPVDFEVPPRFAVQGGLFADLNGDGVPETVNIRSRVLSIYEGDKLIYQSPEQMGGSLSAMTYELNPGSEDTLTSTEAFEVPPVARDLDGDGAPEIVAVGSEMSPLRVPGIGPGVKKSWLAVIKHRGDMFVKGKIGEELDTPIQGFTVTDDAVFLVATESSSLLGEKGKSQLLSFPLK